MNREIAWELRSAVPSAGPDRRQVVNCFIERFAEEHTRYNEP